MPMYLGVQLTVEGTTDYEVECCIHKAETAQNEVRTDLCDSRFSLALRVQLLNVCVFTAFIYSADSWDLSDKLLCRALNHFGHRCMAILLKREVQSISAEECSLANPVQTLPD